MASVGENTPPKVCHVPTLGNFTLDLVSNTWVPTSTNTLSVADIDSFRNITQSPTQVFLQHYKLSDGTLIQCGGLFKLSDSTLSDNTGLVLVTKAGKSYTRVLPSTGDFCIDWWFETTDQTDYSKTLTRCATYFKSSNDDDTAILDSPRNVTVVGTGGVRKMLSGVTIYAYMLTWDFKNTILDFSGCVDDTTYIWLRGAKNAVIRNVRVLGKWSGNNITVTNGAVTIRDKSTGILLHTLAQNMHGATVDSIVFDNVHVTNTHTAVNYGNNTYIHKWQNCTFTSNFRCLNAYPNYTNTGENVSFSFCVFANNVMYVDGNFFFTKYEKCSFDYSGVGDVTMASNFSNLGLFNMAAGDFNGCHFEWGNPYSYWSGPIFISDRIAIRYCSWWVASVDTNITNQPLFCKALDITTAKLEIIDFDVPNTGLSGFSGAWGNGQAVSFTSLSVSSYPNMWRNFWSSDPKDYGNFRNSVLPGMAENSTSDGTASNAVAFYKAKTNIQLDNVDGKINTIDYDGTSHGLILTTTATTDNTVSLTMYAPNKPGCAALAAVTYFVKTLTNAKDSSNPSLSFQVQSGIFDSVGTFIKLQDLTWAPVGDMSAGTVYTSSLAVDSRPLSSAFATHVRIKVTLSNFKVSGGQMVVVIRCPRLELVNVKQIQNIQTV